MVHKALMVDDDKLMLDLLDYFLTRNGYDISRATDANQAIQILDSEDFDLVITDLQMGRTSGIDIIRKIKTTTPETIVIMITGSCENKDKVEAFHHGADDFLLKPFFMSDLLQRIHVQESRQLYPPRSTFDIEQRAREVSG